MILIKGAVPSYPQVASIDKREEISASKQQQRRQRLFALKKDAPMCVCHSDAELVASISKGCRG